jgi:hypothetical protein
MIIAGFDVCLLEKPSIDGARGSLLPASALVPRRRGYVAGTTMLGPTLCKSASFSRAEKKQTCEMGALGEQVCVWTRSATAFRRIGLEMADAESL